MNDKFFGVPPPSLGGASGAHNRSPWRGTVAFAASPGPGPLAGVDGVTVIAGGVVGGPVEAVVTAIAGVVDGSLGVGAGRIRGVGDEDAVEMLVRWTPLETYGAGCVCSAGSTIDLTLELTLPLTCSTADRVDGCLSSDSV